MSPKVTGGLVVVDPTKLAAVDQYGVDQIALKVPWSTINPSDGVYDWSFIDNYLSNFPTTRFTLRIQSGNTCPDWLKTITGTVEVYLTSRNQTAFVCHWWEEVAMAAWENMIQAAGSRYDSNPRVVMVSADAPMVVYSEPYILGSDQASGARLFSAGLNQTTMIAAITRCVQDTANAFPNTLVELAIHGQIQIPVSGGMIFSWPIGRQLAIDLATVHGKHLVFSDYGLGTANTFAAHAPAGGETIYNTADVYTFMYLRTLPSAGILRGPVTFQLTVGQEPQVQATYQQAAQNAIDLGGWQCETSGWGLLSTTAGTYDLALKNNAAEGFPTGQPAGVTSPAPVGVFTGGNDSGTGPVTTQTLTLPASAAAGDVAIIESSAFSTSATATISSFSGEGWTLVSGPNASATGANYRSYLWSKVLSAADIGHTVAVTWSAQLPGLATGVVYPAGCTIGPAGYATAPGGSTSITPAGITANAGDTLLIIVTQKANSGVSLATATLPNSVVSDKTAATALAAGTNFGTIAAHQPVAASGTVGASPITYSPSTNGLSVYTLAVAPPPASSPGLPVFLRSGGAWVSRKLVRVP